MSVHVSPVFPKFGTLYFPSAPKLPRPVSLPGWCCRSLRTYMYIPHVLPNPVSQPGWCYRPSRIYTFHCILSFLSLF